MARIIQRPDGKWTVSYNLNDDKKTYSELFDTQPTQQDVVTRLDNKHNSTTLGKIGGTVDALGKSLVKITTSTPKAFSDAKELFTDDSYGWTDRLAEWGEEITEGVSANLKLTQEEREGFSLGSVLGVKINTAGIASGAGSVAGFWAGGGLVKGGVLGLANFIGRGDKVIKSARFMNVIMAGLESGVEASDVKEEMRKKGASEEEIDSAYRGVLAANLVLNSITNRFGLDDEARALSGQLLAKAFTKLTNAGAGAVNEGLLQETGQKVISNYATGKPIMDNVAESAIYGAILGGGVSALAKTKVGESLIGKDEVPPMDPRYMSNDQLKAHLIEITSAKGVSVDPTSKSFQEVSSRIQQGLNEGFTMEELKLDMLKQGVPPNVASEIMTHTQKDIDTKVQTEIDQSTLYSERAKIDQSYNPDAIAKEMQVAEPTLNDVVAKNTAQVITRAIRGMGTSADVEFVNSNPDAKRLYEAYVGTNIEESVGKSALQVRAQKQVLTETLKSMDTSFIPSKALRSKPLLLTAIEHMQNGTRPTDIGAIHVYKALQAKVKERQAQIEKTGIKGTDLIVEERTVSIEEAQSVVEEFFSKSEMSVTFSTNLTTPLGQELWGKSGNGFIQMVKNEDGTTFKGTAEHEVLHQMLNLFIPQNERTAYNSKALEELKQNPTRYEALKQSTPRGSNMNEAEHDRVVAEEYLAEEFVTWLEKKKQSDLIERALAPRTFLEKFYEKVRIFVRSFREDKKTDEKKPQDLFERLIQIKEERAKALSVFKQGLSNDVSDTFAPAVQFANMVTEGSSGRRSDYRNMLLQTPYKKMVNWAHGIGGETAMYSLSGGANLASIIRANTMPKIYTVSKDTVSVETPLPTQIIRGTGKIENTASVMLMSDGYHVLIKQGTGAYDAKVFGTKEEAEKYANSIKNSPIQVSSVSAHASIEVQGDVLVVKDIQLGGEQNALTDEEQFGSAFLHEYNQTSKAQAYALADKIAQIAIGQGKRVYIENEVLFHYLTKKYKTKDSRVGFISFKKEQFVPYKELYRVAKPQPVKGKVTKQSVETVGVKTDSSIEIMPSKLFARMHGDKNAVKEGATYEVQKQEDTHQLSVNLFNEDPSYGLMIAWGSSPVPNGDYNITSIQEQALKYLRKNKMLLRAKSLEVYMSLNLTRKGQDISFAQRLKSKSRSYKEVAIDRLVDSVREGMVEKYNKKAGTNLTYEAIIQTKVGSIRKIFTKPPTEQEIRIIQQDLLNEGLEVIEC